MTTPTTLAFLPHHAVSVITRADSFTIAYTRVPFFKPLPADCPLDPCHAGQDGQGVDSLPRGLVADFSGACRLTDRAAFTHWAQNIDSFVSRLVVQCAG